MTSLRLHSPGSPSMPPKTTTGDISSPVPTSAPESVAVADEDNGGKKSKRKRTVIAAACSSCRKSKLKCNGGRPVCDRCEARQLSCEYDTEPNVSRMLSLKRKYSSTLEQHSQMQELYEHLNNRPENEAFEILRYLRMSRDPASVINLLNTGAILAPPAVFNSPDQTATEILSIVDQHALQNSPIKVPARPWTTVAGDGLVSELISCYFGGENTFLTPFFEEEAFVAEMQGKKRKDTIEYCSPLLINAICAIGCFASPTAKRYDYIQRNNIGEKFFNEFKKLFDCEQGAVSIPTAQALYFGYIYASSSGKDRIGTIFRYAASEMLQRLGYGKATNPLLSHVQGPISVKVRIAVSQIVWSLFCIESICSFAYIQASLLPMPAASRYFHDPLAATSLSAQILENQCDISELLYQIMTWQANKDPVKDLEHRHVIYQRILKVQRGLPPQEQYTSKNMQCYYFLKCYCYLSTIALFSPVQATTATTTTTSSSSPPHSHTPPTPTPSEICLDTSESLVTSMHHAHKTIPHSQLGTLLIFFCYCAGYTIIARINTTPRARNIFSTVAHIFSQTAAYFPVSAGLLQGLKAMTKEVGVSIPEEAADYFKEIKLGSGTRDVPISFVLPQHSYVVERLKRGRDKKSIDGGVDSGERSGGSGGNSSNKNRKGKGKAKENDDSEAKGGKKKKKPGDGDAHRHTDTQDMVQSQQGVEGGIDGDGDDEEDHDNDDDEQDDGDDDGRRVTRMGRELGTVIARWSAISID